MSLPNSTPFGSYPASNVREIINSYRRAQFYLSESVSSSIPSIPGDDLSNDIEQGPAPEVEDQVVVTPRPQDNTVNSGTVIGEWDEDLLTPGTAATAPILMPTYDRRQTDQSSITIKTGPPTQREAPVRESTPLLHEATSHTLQKRPNYTQSTSDGTGVSLRNRPTGRHGPQVNSISRVPNESTTSLPAKHLPVGQSTFGQTLFNAIAILFGIGMLSEPLAFAYAGWIGGTFLIIAYGFVTCYTGKILAHILLSDSRLRSYSDIGRKAFGPRSAPWISAVFCLELFTVGVALVTLYGDSLHSVLPIYSINIYKIFGVMILIPTMLLPLSVLSYVSIVGILSTLFIVAVMFVDGFSKSDAPGSLWSPSHTSFGIHSPGELGVAFGLFMAGFSGHAVIPSLVKDMKDPSQCDAMLDYAFFVATIIYAIIGVAGYLMFGDSVSDEFSKDLMKIPGYNPILNRVALWGLVLAPLSKYALAMRPLNITLEMLLGIDPGASAPDDHGLIKDSNSNSMSGSSPRRAFFQNLAITIERTIFVCTSVAVSILVPEFSSMMAFLGAFSSFLLCVIGPLSAKMALTGYAKWYDVFLLVVAVAMASWGTGAAFWSTA